MVGGERVAHHQEYERSLLQLSGRTLPSALQSEAMHRVRTIVDRIPPPVFSVRDQAPELRARRRTSRGLLRAAPPRNPQGCDVYSFQQPSAEELEQNHLHRNGTRVIKFFLHLSKEEQRKCLLERIDQPDKNWRFSEADIAERQSGLSTCTRTRTA